jgi:16S rRNA (cytidine1402-2'-O)-methyltransferase
VSGLPVDRFAFEGFVPRRAGERSRRLAELASDPRTLVLFEAPHRVAATLSALAESFGGDRPAAVCRELTKTYEEVRRGTLDELVAWAAAGVRGEVTLVVGGADPRSVPASGATSPAGLARLVADAEAAGLERKEAIASVAAATGVRRRDVYDAVVAARAQDRPAAQDQRSGQGR